MASLNYIVLGILILQLYVYAAPNDVSKLEEIAKVEQADPKVEQTDPKVEQTDPKEEETDPKLDSEPKEVESDNNSTETQRHKRWYNPDPYYYGISPFNPFMNQGINKRDEGTNTGYYGEDPLAQIHRRIQEIAHFVRQPQQQPPPLPHFPIYYPVLFIPPGDCNCNNENQNPTTPDPFSPVTTNNNNGDSTDTTTPSISSRWPEMDDNRQNWGFALNESDTEEGVDFNRPISFDPIRLNKPMRPAPPVEHGTIQSDSNDQNRPQSEAPEASFQAPPSRPQPATTRRPPQNRPQNTQPPQNRPQSQSSDLAPPSRCESALITCCHQAQVVYDCFAILGCPDLTGYGSPCDPKQILQVIDKFRMYYGE